uniref:Pentatricopeptide repeat-containing protein At2g15980 n=1 Tax=Anthurium amnicola TaxID=1678845 RepID=A0A1D1YR24_9ARAE
MAIRVGRPLLLSPPTSPALLRLPPPPPPSSPAELSVVGGGEGEDDTLVADVVSVLRQQRSRSRWGFLKSLCGPEGFTAEQAARITLGLRNNPRLALRFFHWSEEASLCRHDLPSYAAMVHVLARARLRPAAQSLIRSAILHVSDGGDGPMAVFAALARTYRACDSAPLVFDLLIRACLQARRVDRAVEIARMLRIREISPAVGTCNELIRAVSKGKGAGAVAGFHLYEELFGTGGGDDGAGAGAPRWMSRMRPNVQTFNALLLSFHREDGRWEDAEKIRTEMDRFACRPNCFTYSILMAGLCEEGMVRQAEALWDQMAAEGIKPDATAYNTLIGGFCGVGEMGRAEELFREMVMGGIEPTGTGYDRMIGGYCSTGDVDNALLLFDEMLGKDFRPEASTVGELIGELCRKSKVEEGLRVLRGEMRRGACVFFPTRQVFVYLIEGFCRRGQMEEGLKLQGEMAGEGFEPGPEVYSALIQGYSERGDVEMAARLKDEMMVNYYPPGGGSALTGITRHTPGEAGLLSEE